MNEKVQNVTDLPKKRRFVPTLTPKQKKIAKITAAVLTGGAVVVVANKLRESNDDRPSEEAVTDAPLEYNPTTKTVE